MTDGEKSQKLKNQDPDAQLLSETPDELRPARIAYVRERWKQLADAQKSRGEGAVRYLMLINAGGAVAVLSFMGAMQKTTPVPGAPAMLGLFIIGIILVGLVHARQLYGVHSIFREWQQGVQSYYADHLTWGELVKQDQQRSRDYGLAAILGWLSFACFIVAVGIGLTNIGALSTTTPKGVSDHGSRASPAAKP